jgi:peptidoglycan/xylan/chitin deacetylase (PgdA/CDA1 family)
MAHPLISPVSRGRYVACLSSLVLLAHCSSSPVAEIGDPGNTAPGTHKDGGPSVEGDGGHAGSDGGILDSGHPKKDSSVGDDSGPIDHDGGDHDAGDHDGGPSSACTNNPGHEDPGEFPQTDFDPQPPYIPNDTLVLTIDDVPDTNNTPLILDILKARNIKATFFINTMNWGGPDSLIKRMIDEGHEIANHTVHHPHLPTTSDIEGEIAGVETAIDTISGGTIKRLTLFRAPYGEPYQSGTDAEKALVLPIVAKHAVAINWNFDTLDTTTTDATVVYNTFVDAVKTPGAAGAAWGIFLMHGVHPWDVDVLPRILDYVKANHFKLARVEDVLCWRFGKRSEDLIGP